MLALIFLAGCLLLLAGYRFYGRNLSNWLGVDPSRPTPAHEYADGIDYVPSHTPVLFGHHFSSIAGAGPIVGPILAAIWFGWLPALLWILIGAIFVGGVHDYTAMMASIRNRGRSIGEICRQYLSPLTYRVFLVFIWFTLVYVLVVFLDLTAATFAPTPDSQTGGAVATASLSYIVIALLFGLAVKRFGINFKIATLVCVPLVFLGIVAGDAFPLTGRYLPLVYAGDPKYTWCLILLVYCFIASITPVWILLQPRDYLSSFLLYGCLLGGGIGLVIAGFTGAADIAYPAFVGWWRVPETRTGFIFPLLFITVACGAVSGFHSIVASGTSSKQLHNEGAAKPVAYGGMLVEGVLALVALAAVMLAAKGDPILGKHPTSVFAAGMGTFLGVLHIPEAVGARFGFLAISTFLLTTLDTGTRLSRFIFEEFFSLRDARWRYVSTAATLVLPAAVVFMRFKDPLNPGIFIPAWRYVWPVFGTTNQLLAALALLVVAIWLANQKRRFAYVVIPMLFMLATTVVMLVNLIGTNLFAYGGKRLIGSICLLLLVLAIMVVIDTILHWWRGRLTGTA